MKIDPDIKKMSPAKRAEELMRWRQKARAMISPENNARCWLNDMALCALLPEKRNVGSITLPRKTFLKNCAAYFDRQTGPQGARKTFKLRRKL